MKRNCIYIFIFLNFVFHLNTLFATQQSNIEFKFYYSDSSVNPLAAYSSEWNRSDYENCNTAKDISYLSSEEKNVIWVLNMMRLNPQLFLSSVLLNPKCEFYKAEKKRNRYYNSLINDLKSAHPIQSFLNPELTCYESARCHALSSGEKGYVGHDRVNKDCKMDFYGECCQYGYSRGLDIVLDLLLDYDVPSVGHRKICMSDEYLFVGSSIKPHTVYQFNTVIDFK